MENLFRLLHGKISADEAVSHSMRINWTQYCCCCWCCCCRCCDDCLYLLSICILLFFFIFVVYLFLFPFFLLLWCDAMAHTNIHTISLTSIFHDFKPISFLFALVYCHLALLKRKLKSQRAKERERQQLNKNKNKNEKSNAMRWRKM